MTFRNEKTLSKTDSMTDSTGDAIRHDPDLQDSIAVIGMAGRFPGARTVEQFWQNMRDGVESVRFFGDAELAAAGVPESERGAPDYVPAKGVLDDIAGFDAGYFGFNPREAALLDPQQRLFLEVCVEVLERAGAVPGRQTRRFGVFGGVSKNTYMFFNLLSREELRTAPGAMQALISNDKDYLATRVSYKLGLRGPSLTVQTACSSSLVAVHLACQSLLTGESEYAIAGGVAVDVPHHAGYRYEPGGIFSPDGHCRTFDASARGTVFGQGAGVVLLRRLADAMDDGDTVLAVIRGSSVNNDGAVKVGFTAPSVEGQREVIAEAMTSAGVDPGTVSYIEAHGTGTPLGDPIEVEALTKAFRLWTDRTGFCRLGSVKTNVGHLNAAAGVTGLIKTVLALQHAEIPPSLHFERPNPQIRFDETPFVVNAALSSWPDNDGGDRRRAGVSSFGIGGTNAHVVLEAAPPQPSPRPGRPWQLVPISARTTAALATAAKQLGDELATACDMDPANAHLADADLADVAWTMQTGRHAFPQRRFVVPRDMVHAAELLAEPATRTASGAAANRPKVAFLFPGQGSQYPNMARELYEDEPVFRDQVDACSRRLVELGAPDPREILFPGDLDLEAAADRLTQTELAQPVLFTVEYALTRLWASWGVEPDAVLGHSLGEIVAACVAGVLDLEDALRLVAVRARAIGELPTGDMIAIAASADRIERIEPRIPENVEIAALNAPDLTVLSGPTSAIKLAVEFLQSRDLKVRHLDTSHAFHSAMMNPAVGVLTECATRLTLRPPRIRCLSNVTGTWLGDEDAVDPAYWGRQLRHPVRFAAGVGELLTDPDLTLLEVGPGGTLTQLARRHPGWSSERVAVSSLPGRRPSPPGHEPPSGDRQAMLTALGRLWVAGVEPRWEALHTERRRRVVLPAYPFERAVYWIDPASHPVGGAPTDSSAPMPQHERPAVTAAFADAGTDLERAVVEAFEALLGIREIGVRDDFFELGGHSLLGVDLVSRIRNAVGVELPLGAIFERPNPRDIAALAERALADGLEQALAGVQTDSAEDIWFDRPGKADTPVISPAPTEAPDVLLTGATGFLGSFLLRELLDRTSSVVHCLVRASDPQAGLAKIRAGLEKYGLLGDAELDRVKVVPGDLAAERLGLADGDYEALAGRVHAVYHNGAKVSFLEPYRILRRTNVDGTREILRFACAGPVKPVHHVSSIAVFDCDNFAGMPVAADDADLAGGGGFHGGYDQSKWVAEMVVEQARTQGVPVTIYRPGNIAGHSRTGAVSDGHLVSAMIEGCVRLGLAPDSDAYVDVVPVDYVSSALVAISLREDALGGTFNLVNPSTVRWNEIVDELNKVGYAVRRASLPDWIAAIRADELDGNAMRAFLPMLEERALFSGRRYRCERTLNALAGTGIACPPLNAELIGTYVRALSDIKEESTLG
jgi:phthiocerol/phenolphthiocerol synthesis type-I polyketide synthase E